MVAQINGEMFVQASSTPGPISSDPDDVRLALETAQAFEAMGKIPEAVAWLKSAAERADKQGQHGRAFVLAQATAELTNRTEPISSLASTPSSPPPSDVRDGVFVRPPPTKLPACPPSLHASSSSQSPPARVSSLLPPPPRKSRPQRKSSLPPVPMLPQPPPARMSSPPTNGAGVSSSPKGPPRASAPPKRSSRAPAGATLSSRPALALAATPADVPSTERTARVNTLRVVIAGSVPGAGPFTIERLHEGQPLPPGTREATLVLSDEVDR
jgi:hypothetical protein